MISYNFKANLTILKMPGDCVLSPGINLLSLYPLFSLFSFFGFILISCNSHGCIGLDVIVVQRIVVLVEAGRAEERKCLRGNGLRRGNDYAPLQVDLGICRVRIVLRQSGLFVEDVAAEAFLCRGVCFIALPVDGIDADGAWQYNDVVRISCRANLEADFYDFEAFL